MFEEEEEEARESRQTVQERERRAERKPTNQAQPLEQAGAICVLNHKHFISI